MSMKLFLTGLLILTGLVSEAQNKRPFWVIENNESKNLNTIVRIYDEYNNLLHEETISGKRLNILKSKDKRFLNRKLKEVVKREELASARKK